MIAAVCWTFGDRLTIGPGIGVFPDLTDDAEVSPILAIVWAIGERRALTTGQGGGATRTVPVLLTLDRRPAPGIPVSGFAGVETGTEATLRDDDGAILPQNNADPAARPGAQVAVRF